MIEKGDQFPKFSLLNQDGNEVTEATLAGAMTVFYFYPKDDTSGCTAEACGFQERLSEIPGARVIGISPDSPKSHRKFADKYNLSFTLLADEAHLLSEAVGVWVEKSMYGKKYMGIERTTYLVGSDGKVAEVWRKVKPQGHAEEVIAALK